MGASSSREDNQIPYRNYDSPPQQYYHPYDHQQPPPELYRGGYPTQSNPSQNSNTNSIDYHHQISPHPNRKRFERTYSRIADEFKTLEEVSSALADAGLESSNLIVGIDFTKSNEWTGKRSFDRLNLHHVGERMNPYEQAIHIIGKSLSSFDEDNMIPCFGFGDATTHDQDVFSFYPDGQPCDGFEDALSRYREIVPELKLSGPTSFAPIIEMATTIVEESGGQYHVLLIIADGQVTRSVNTEPGRFSPQELQTVDAIVRASQYPLSIVLVGVGDGPWDMMKEFDDHIPRRDFDNFQFVNFTEIMLKKTDQMRKEKEFALAALMKIPMQYRATLQLGILGVGLGDLQGGLLYQHLMLEHIVGILHFLKLTQNVRAQEVLQQLTLDLIVQSVTPLLLPMLCLTTITSSAQSASFAGKTWPLVVDTGHAMAAVHLFPTVQSAEEVSK